MGTIQQQLGCLVSTMSSTQDINLVSGSTCDDNIEQTEACFTIQNIPHPSFVQKVKLCDIATVNNPVTTAVLQNSTFSTTTDYLYVSYTVQGTNGTIQTAANSTTRTLLDGETGEFRADNNNTLSNIITFTTGADTTVVVNGIIRI